MEKRILLELDDLDAALNGLAQPAAPTADPSAPAPSDDAPPLAANDNDTTQSATPPPLAGQTATPPPMAPPPMRGRKPGLGAVPALTPKDGTSAARADGGQGPLPTEWHGRAGFDDLFVSDPTPAPAGRGNPDEKVEYFREKLKRAETQAARFRDAWQARERELDTLETLFKKEQGTSERERTAGVELSQKISTIERFLDQKKQEFEAYGQKVTAAFAQKDEQEKTLRTQIETLADAHAVKLADKDQELSTLQSRLDGLQNELTAQQNARQAEAQSLGQQLNQLEQDKQAGETRLGDMGHELELSRTELVETRDALERDVAVRNEAIEKLKSSIEKQREAIVERDTQIDALSVQVSQLNQDIAQVRVETENAQGTAAAERQELESAWRIERSTLENTWLTERTELEGQVASRQQDVETARQETETVRQEAEAARAGADDELRVRDEVIEKLKAAIHTQRATMEERNTQIETLQQELETMRLAGADKALETDEMDAQNREQIEELNRGLAMRDEAIDKLKASLENSKTRFADMQEQLNALQQTSQDSAGVAGQERERTADIISRTRKALEVAQKLLA